jgi:hypothetical protein
MVTSSERFEIAPILAHRHHNAPSVFTPETLLREARRQKGLAQGSVPAVCVLDPDGDLIDYLNTSGSAERASHLGPLSHVTYHLQTG